MQHQEKYTLTWNSYSDHLREAMKDMMTSSDFSDVTLVTDDKQQIRAHRNILSACSPVFQNIFQLHSSINNANSVIYLRGIQHSEMESIMQFLYLGEARFYKDRLSEFFQVAKDLEIKNISTGIEMNVETAWKVESNEHEMKIVPDEVPPQSFNEKLTGKDGSKYPCDQCDQLFTTQSNLNTHVQSAHEGVKYTRNQCDKQYAERSNLTKHIQKQHKGVKYACNQCDYQATRQFNLTTHIQSIHEGVKYPCNQCDYKATMQNNLTKHIQSKHEGIKYACYQCDYQATRQDNLTTHIQSVHEGIKYDCNQCDYKATQKTNLTTHIKKKHL